MAHYTIDIETKSNNVNDLNTLQFKLLKNYLNDLKTNGYISNYHLEEI